MYYRIQLSLIISLAVLLLIGGCDSSITRVDQNRPLLNIPEYGTSALPGVGTKDGNLTIQASGDAPPAYYLLKGYAKENPDYPYIGVVGIWNTEKEQYRYKSIPLEFPDEILEEAKGETKYYWYRLSAKESGILRNFAAIIPAVPQAREGLTNWLQVQDRDKVITDDSAKVNPMNKKTLDTGSEEVSGKDSGNIDRTQTMYCYKWFPETGLIYSICEDLVVIDTRDNEFTQGNGSGPGNSWPDLDGMPDGDQGFPDSGGSSGGSQPKPCKGDVVENPQIAPGGGWNMRGGQFGWTRRSSTGKRKHHDGTDIKMPVNTDLHAMHGGTVTDLRKSLEPGEFRPDSYGNYIRIKSRINGVTVYLIYNHLNSVSVKEGDIVSPGDLIGKSGNTGNAQTKNGIKVIPHVHIRARKVVDGKETKVDPEDYMATNFNDDGSINESKSDCNKFED